MMGRNKYLNLSDRVFKLAYDLYDDPWKTILIHSIFKTRCMLPASRIYIQSVFYFSKIFQFIAGFYRLQIV